MKGFDPKSPEDWNEADWSTGCVRRTPLSCHGDGFAKFSGLKLPDTQRSSWFNMSMSLEDCAKLCMNNCFCTAYAALDVREEKSGCLLWHGDLIDIRQLSEPQQDIYVRMSKKELGIRSSPNFYFFIFIFFLCYSSFPYCFLSCIFSL